MKKTRLFSFKYFLYDFIKVTAAIPGLIFFRPKRLYISKEAKKRIKGSALVISNHIGKVDPLYILMSIWSRRLHFVSNVDLIKNKFHNFLFKYAFLSVIIDRQKFSLTSLKEIIGLLEGGNVVVMFPEGHVNTESEGINDFKNGMILMAYKGNAPIIPVYIKRRFHWYDRLVVCFGEPIDIKEKFPDLRDKDKASAYLKEKEIELEKFCEGKN